MARLILFFAGLLVYTAVTAVNIVQQAARGFPEIAAHGQTSGDWSNAMNRKMTHCTDCSSSRPFPELQ